MCPEKKEVENLPALEITLYKDLRKERLIKENSYRNSNIKINRKTTTKNCVPFNGSTK